MPNHPDGSTVSSYFGLKNQESGKDIKDQGVKTKVGQVDKIHFTDDASNVSKKFVEYDVVLRDENGGQSTLKNVRCESALGGANDFEETILEPNQVAFTGPLNSSNLFSNKNGALVYVSFRDGSLDKPYIEGSVPHARKEGARRSDGIRKIGEYRGLQWNINADGELIITYNGSRNPDGNLVRPDTGPTVIKISKTGAVTISDNAGQTISVDRTTKTISFSNGTSIVMDKSADSIIVKTAGGGEVKIAQGKIAIGTSSVELLQQISDSLQELITFLTSEASHTHIGNLGYPTAPPSNASADSTASSNLSTIKGKVDSIKGSI